jgi:histidine ammonia-lyase
MKPNVIIGVKTISLNSLIEVANERAKVFISESDEFISRMEASRSVLHMAISQGTPVYGVTTGYGASCGNRIGSEDIEVLGIKETRNVPGSRCAGKRAIRNGVE